MDLKGSVVISSQIKNSLYFFLLLNFNINLFNGVSFSVKFYELTYPIYSSP